MATQVTDPLRSLRRTATAVAFATCVAMAPVTVTKAHCPACNRVVMKIPRQVVVETQVRTHDAEPSRGRIIRCRPGTCGVYVEVIEHG